MLKIKDNVDLRILKKYKLNDNYIYVPKNGRFICIIHKDDSYLTDRQEDILFDLITAGLVEKVSD